MAATRMVLLFLAVLMAATASAQLKVVTVTEPGVYKLDELLKVADVVAVVKVLSGDTENYEKAVYKGSVVQSFKGTATGQIVYFGPFIGERLGWEYILFLQIQQILSLPKQQQMPAMEGFGTRRFSLKGTLQWKRLTSASSREKKSPSNVTML